jgi:hypothetical protein
MYKIQQIRENFFAINKGLKLIKDIKGKGG